MRRMTPARKLCYLLGLPVLRAVTALEPHRLAVQEAVMSLMQVSEDDPLKVRKEAE